MRVLIAARDVRVRRALSRLLELDGGRIVGATDALILLPELDDQVGPDVVVLELDRREDPRDLRVVGELASAAARPTFGVRVTGVRFLGRGVALDLAAAELTALRSSLAAAFGPWLTRQDRQWSRPHVTVQNKVDPAVARETVAALRAAFVPETVAARGLGLWRYLGGPWEPEGEFPFR